jgi:hypothetical protein
MSQPQIVIELDMSGYDKEKFLQHVNENILRTLHSLGLIQAKLVWVEEELSPYGSQR